MSETARYILECETCENTRSFTRDPPPTSYYCPDCSQNSEDDNRSDFVFPSGQSWIQAFDTFHWSYVAVITVGFVIGYFGIGPLVFLFLIMLSYALIAYYFELFGGSQE